MATTFHQINTGAVGNRPKLFQLFTSDDQATVEEPGYLNKILTSTPLTANPGSFVLATIEDGDDSIIYVAERNDGIFTLVDIAGSSGGGGGNFDYERTFFVAQNGDDANSGSSINTPKQTIAGAIAAFESPTAPGVIIILDEGTYTESNILNNSLNLKVFAPNATIVGSGGNPAFTVGENGELSITCDTLQGTPVAIDVTATNSDLIMRDIDRIVGDIVGDGPSGSIEYDCGFHIGDLETNKNTVGTIRQTLTGGITKTSNNTVNISLDVSKVNGNINVADATFVLRCGEWSGTTFSVTETVAGNSFLAVDVAKTSDDYAISNLSIQNPPQGTFGAKVYGSQFTRIIYSTVTTPVEINASSWQDWDGALVLHNNADQRRFDFTNDTQIPRGFTLSALQQDDGRVNFNFSDSATLPVSETRNNVIYTDRFGSRMDMIKLDSAAQPLYGVTGDIWSTFSAANTGPNIFVSQAVGDDVLGNGTEESPFATIGKAITEAGAPVTPVAIRVIDSGTYAETLTFNNPNVFVLAPTAILTNPGPADDIIVVNTNSPNLFFANIGVLLQTGTGNLVTHNGTASYLINATTFQGPMSMGDAPGTIRSFSGISSDLTVNDGTLTYTGSTRSGTNTITGTGNIRGITAESALADNFTFSEDVICGDNTAGNVGTLRLNSGTIGGLNFTPLATTNDAYATIQNASLSQTRAYTLPEVSAVTSYFNVSDTPPDIGSNLIVSDATVGQAGLAGGGSISLNAATLGAQYRIREIFLNSDGTNFSGGGGDRDIEIFSGANVYSVIPAATVQAFVNARWGSTEVPFPASVPINELTPTSLNIAARYSGGTADYTAGTLSVTVLYERVV